MRIQACFFILFFCSLLSAQDDLVCSKKNISNQPSSCLGISGKAIRLKDKKILERNVLGKELQVCGKDPLTGFYRSGYCQTGLNDSGVHTVCAKMTQEFLDFSLSKGNDLITPQPQYGFVGLKPGQMWCLCADRWLESAKAGKAPPVNLEATHEKSLQKISLDQLVEHKF